MQAGIFDWHRQRHRILSNFSFQLSAFSFQLSAFCFLLSAFCFLQLHPNDPHLCHLENSVHSVSAAGCIFESEVVTDAPPRSRD
jgi:hypothetical protein